MPRRSPYESVPAIETPDGLVEKAAKAKPPPAPVPEPAPTAPPGTHDLVVSNAELAEALASFQHVFEPE
jgi:hypothetical protein